MKVANIFEKSHNFKGWEKIQKWIEDDDICAKINKPVYDIKFELIKGNK